MNTNDYLRNLKKWQASSHPGLANSKPEQLFVADFVGLYNELHKKLWRRIMRVHGTLYTLEQLKEFPFDYLYGPNDMEFWRLVAENFFDVVCLLLHGLVGDKGQDVCNIRWFRDQIIQARWLDSSKRDMLVQTLRGRRFDADVESIARDVTEIRHNMIAHLLIDKRSGDPKTTDADVSLENLRMLFDATHSLFGALSFGAGYVTLAGDLMPSTVGGQASRTCLDKILDAVLRDSDFVNDPERRAPWWAAERKHMDAEELQVMNELRKRIGLPEA